VPPQDLGAEQSVLGSMLLDKDAIADCLEAVKGHDFYRPAHELIFDAVLDLFGRGEPADAITVADELSKRGDLARVGGQAYLHQLIQSVPTAANAGYYAEIVHERAVLRRLDHSNIFLIIAGTYTPFALLLPPDQGRTLLVIVWTGAVVGVLFRVFWSHAPRWLYVPVYVLLGWVAVFYFGPLLDHVGGAVMAWVVLGGVLYSIGAVVYGTKRPDISPRWFGFHEVFHALTVLAFGAHFVAASMALSAGASA